MNIVLWILQVLLALQFLQHGWMMVFPPAEYVQIMNESLGIGLRYFIGIAELLAVFGIILPGLLRIQTWLVPFTAAGLTVISLLASITHFYRGETSSGIYTAVLFVITAFVTYMRWKIKPISKEPAGLLPYFIVAGGILGILLSYYFQTEMVKAQWGNIINYLKNLNMVPLIPNLLICVAVCSAIGAVIGYFVDKGKADQKKFKFNNI